MREALIDLGSNSFRLLVSESGDEVLRRSEHLHLASTLNGAGFLENNAIERALQTVREYVRVAADHGCGAPTVVATEVFRLAANGPAVLDHIAAEVGIQIRLLSRSEEAMLSWKGAGSALPQLRELTVADLGGGSLTLATGPNFAPRPEFHFARSLGVSLLAPCAQRGDQLSPGARVRLEGHIADELRGAAATLDAYPDRPIVLVGGWPRALAQVMHTSRRGQVPESVHGLDIDCADLGHLIMKLSDLSTSARLAVPGMKHRRAAYLPTAATILRQTLRSLNAHTAVVSAAGLRDGITTQLALSHRAA